MPLGDVFNRALAAFQKGQLDDAARGFKKFLRSDPRHFGALNLYSVLLLQRGQLAEAEKYLRQAISVDARSDQTFYNYGIALKGLKKPHEAAEAFTRAIELNPTVAETWNNRGTSFNDLGQYSAAIADFDRAIALSPGYADAFFNKGNSLRLMGDQNAALAEFHRAVQIQPGFGEAWQEIAFLLGSKSDHPGALAACKRALAANPKLKFAKVLRFLSSTNLCEWATYAEDTAEVIASLDSDRPEVSIPSVYLKLPASARQQLRAATSFSEGFAGREASPPAHPTKRERIKVAYISSDFRDHATAHLISGVFEHHDRSQFEIVGISTALETADPSTQRIKRAVDEFYDVSAKSDDDVATLLRESETDITVDLNGYTQGMRPGIFARRPAPVQVNYIGYPGTMGSRHIDYIIADQTVIPPGEDVFYLEKIVRLPDTFQPNDDKRFRPDCSIARADFGLPAKGVVFCCFNNTYKITPDIFDIWMRLLKRVEGSILWLFEGYSSTKVNLVNEADRRGVGSERLVFAPRVSYSEYLARYRLADMFLDGPYYNGGATASDALWMGLPVITREGGTFASRMASSLLNAIGMPELITTSLEDYETLALKIASDPDLLRSLKEKLARNILSTPLFDTARYTRNLEAAFHAMIERHWRGEKPAPITI